LEATVELLVYNAAMSDVTRILLAIEDGEDAAADELLPLVVRPSWA
jgi:hypothetical protein